MTDASAPSARLLLPITRRSPGLLDRERCVFVCSRRRLEAAVGRVASRFLGGSAARWINRISVSSAASRLRSCVR